MMVRMSVGHVSEDGLITNTLQKGFPHYGIPSNVTSCVARHIKQFVSFIGLAQSRDICVILSFY